MTLIGLVVLGCIAMTAIAAAPARGTTTGTPVAVRIINTNVVPLAVLNRAKGIASIIFAGIGIELQWQPEGRSSEPRDETIGILFDGETSLGGKFEMVALARPYAAAGSSIRVFYGHLGEGLSADQRGKLLGHVIAHEIGHVLERINRHSARGIMKASWNAHDLQQMAFRPLRFDPIDVELIYTGIANHSTGLTKAWLMLAGNRAGGSFW